MSTHTAPLANEARLAQAPHSALVVAIGRAGCEMAQVLRRDGPAGLSYVALDADAAAIQSVDLCEKLFLGARLTRGFGAGGDPELARTAAEEDLPALKAACQGYSLVFILAGLGGGSGTGIAPVVARVAREAGASVFGFVTTPFECEGTRRQQQSLVGLHRLKTVADGVLCLPNEKMLLLTDDRTTLLEAFQASSFHIRDAVTCIWNLLTRPGLLNVSFADICAVLRGPNLESAFARVEVEGEGRAEEALRLILAHPLLARGETLRRAESLLVCFSGGSNLGMGETRRIMDELNRRSDGARVVVGASVDENSGDRLTVTVVASSRQVVLHEPGDEPHHLPRVPPPSAAQGEPPSEDGPSRTARRLAPPPPELTPELADELISRGTSRPKGRRKLQQAPLPFEIITKGRFEKCEPTVRRGHNLDQPTFLRRGVTLN
ncbi:MAG: cell division protein FtsZ [Limisphaerales bacterium]